MRGRSYTNELKESILNEVKEVSNVSLVSRKHGISKSTIATWIRNSKLILISFKYSFKNI